MRSSRASKGGEHPRDLGWFLAGPIEVSLKIARDKILRAIRGNEHVGSPRLLF